MTASPVDWALAPTLHGTHVSIEPLQAAHTDGLRDAASDGRLWELWYTNVPKPEDVPAYVESALKLQATGTQLAMTVRSADGDIVGHTRFYDIDRATPRLQIGYTWYAKRVQRTGLNTEAKLLLLEYAFETLRCAAVGLQTSWFNHASRTAIARLGAKQEGITRNHVRHKDGTLRDTVNFSIIDAEWPAVKFNLQSRLARDPR
jgi:RimJ/RimL family protein N-acetyltransferase